NHKRHRVAPHAKLVIDLHRLSRRQIPRADRPHPRRRTRHPHADHRTRHTLIPTKRLQLLLNIPQQPLLHLRRNPFRFVPRLALRLNATRQQRSTRPKNHRRQKSQPPSLFHLALQPQSNSPTHTSPTVPPCPSTH